MWILNELSHLFEFFNTDVNFYLWWCRERRFEGWNVSWDCNQRCLPSQNQLVSGEKVISIILMNELVDLVESEYISPDGTIIKVLRYANFIFSFWSSGWIIQKELKMVMIFESFLMTFHIVDESSGLFSVVQLLRKNGTSFWLKGWQLVKGKFHQRNFMLSLRKELSELLSGQ